MVTQEQIARKLGVSRQLVTFALAGYPKISPASRQRILATARAMGYCPNPHARALKRGRTGIIALWIPDQISSHYTHVTRELNRLVKQARHELIISELGNGAGEQVLSHVPVDGIMVVDAPKAARAHLESPRAAAIPLISMGADCCDETDVVQVDLRAGTKAVMAYLIGAGFRRIVHATFMLKTGNEPGAARRVGYLEAMRQARLKPEFFYYPLSDQQRKLIRQRVQDYIREKGCPEAIFCHSDDTALGVYRGLCDLKLRVPQDVALVGCDGIQDTEYLEHPLTTLVQPVAEMCAAAWEFLVRRLERPERAWQRKLLLPKLTIRESSPH